MVTVTTEAKQVLKQVLSGQIGDPEVGLRLDVSEGGQFGLFPDRKQEGDQVIAHEGRMVLLVSDELAAPLEGATLDCQRTDEGVQLVVKRREPSSNGASPE
jgi:Fe-S cluster assembly iron-binding protein IscA